MKKTFFSNVRSRGASRLLVFLVVMCWAQSLCAYDFEVNGIYYNITSEREVSVTYKVENNGDYSGVVHIPEVVEYEGITYYVMSIGDKAFYNCTNLETVHFVDKMKSIGNNAFGNCAKFVNIKFNDYLESIGDSAFINCVSMPSIYASQALRHIGKDAFRNCSNLFDVDLAYTKFIGSGAFKGCTSINTIKIYTMLPPELSESVFDEVTEQYASLTVATPDSKFAYEKAPFWENFYVIQTWTPRGDLMPSADFCVDGIYYRFGTTPHTVIVTQGGIDYNGAIEIPRKVEYGDVTYTVTAIDDYTFYDKQGLTGVTIPNSVTYIGGLAFHNCVNLAEINIPDSVTSIGDEAFGSCKKLTKATIGNNVRYISSSLFKYCSSLTEIIIPNSVRFIGQDAFWGCSSLTKVINSDNVRYIGFAAFGDCSNLTELTIGNNVKWIEEWTFCNNSLKSLIIPNSVTSIGANAFNGCSDLMELTIGNGVTTIGEGAFWLDSSITSITSLNTTPPLIGGHGIFDSIVEENATLYVPTGCKEAYMNAPYWDSFFKTEESAGIESIITDKQSKTAIYTLDGKRLPTTNAANLSKGIYIVNGKKYVVK